MEIFICCHSKKDSLIIKCFLLLILNVLALKIFSQNDALITIDGKGTAIFNYKYCYFLKNDTIFYLSIYGNYDKIDSIKIKDTLIKSLDCKCWVYKNIIPTPYYDTIYKTSYLRNDTIKYECKFKEIKNSIWLKNYKELFFDMEKEYKLIYRKEYLHENGIVQ